MKVFFKDVVMSDIEKFLSENESSELPLRQYAEAKWFDYDLFTEFMSKLSNRSYATSNQIDSDNVSVNEIKSSLDPDELPWKIPWPKTRWNKNLVYFSLTDEDLTRYSDIIWYYTAISMFEYRDANAIKNSTEVFDIYWHYTPKHMPEDMYNEEWEKSQSWDRETRFINFPYMMELSQRSNHAGEVKYVDVPERYHKEWYYAWIGSDPQKEIADPDYVERIWDDKSYVFWKLIPTAEETPYDDALPSMTYTGDPIHNSLPWEELQWWSAIKWNIIWDWYANLNRHPRQGK